MSDNAGQSTKPFNPFAAAQQNQPAPTQPINVFGKQAPPANLNIFANPTPSSINLFGEQRN